MQGNTKPMADKKKHTISDELLTRFVFGELSEQEAAYIKSALEDDEIRLDFIQRKNLLDELSLKGISQGIDTEKGLSKLLNTIDQAQAHRHTFRYHTAWKKWLQLAAVITLLLGVGILIKHSRPKVISICSQHAILTDIFLPDSSVIWLNTASEISYPEKFNKKQRTLALHKGEIALKVKPNKECPFIVQTGKLQVIVVGTEFDVALDDSMGLTVVSVQSGTVRVVFPNDQQAPVLLGAGEKCSYSHSSFLIDTLEAASPNDLAWKTGMFVFNRLPLPRVMETIAKAFGYTVRFHSARAANCIITATLDGHDLNTILETLSLTANIETRIANDTIYVSGTGCLPLPD